MIMKIGFVGAGKMAEAILASLLDADVCEAGDIYASDISGERCESLIGQYGIQASTQTREVVNASDIVVFAVKPQELDQALAGLDACAAGKLVVSIAAGKPLSYFEGKLPDSRLVRVMPNLACQVGEGMSVYCGGASATWEDLSLVARIFSASGRTLQLSESLFDVVTALSGSGPAFFAYVLDAMVEAAIGEGMPHDTAMMLAEQTMLGTAKVLLDTAIPPSEFMERVASKGGTTAAGFEVLGKSSVGSDLQATIRAATRRSRELST
jgi:pyrroline-5-carboxylate reductase